MKPVVLFADVAIKATLSEVPRSPRRPSFLFVCLFLFVCSAQYLHRGYMYCSNVPALALAGTMQYWDLKAWF